MVLAHERPFSNEMRTEDNHLNNTGDILHDIELPPAGLTDSMLALIAFTILLLLVLAGFYGHRRQQPLARAKRQLRRLSNTCSISNSSTAPDPDQLARILRQGLQVQRLKDSQLPEYFILRLQHARFSSEPCSPKTYSDLNNEALVLLEEMK